MTRWPAYPAYKPSGLPWLGEIPAHWQIKRLKHLCWRSAIYGANEPSGSYLDDGVRFIRTSDIDDDGNLNSEGAVFLERDSIVEYLLQDDDILLSRSGTLGRSFVYERSLHGECAYAGYLVRFSLQKGFSSRFLFYFTKAKQFTDWLSLAVIQSTIGNVNGQKYANMPIPLPPLQEQRAIFAFLDRETARLDALIAKKEGLIELLGEKRAALISRAVTHGLDSTVLLKDSGVLWLGQIPAHWEVKRLKFVADVRNGTAKGRDFGSREIVEIPYLRVANVQDGYLDLSDVATIVIARDEIPRYTLRVGDVLMNEGGDFDKLGRGSVWIGQIDLCIHQNHVFAVRPRYIGDSAWINTITFTLYAKHYFILKSKQSTNLASISATNLQDLPVVLPPLAERQRILEFIDSETAKLDALTAKVREGVEKLSEYRAALISAAVTGKIDVRG